MIPFLFYLLKVMLCSGLLYGYYHLALRNRVFHQWNRFYLLAAVLLSLLFPLVPMPVFYTQEDDTQTIPLYSLLYSSGSAITVTAERMNHWSWLQILSCLYVVVMLILTIKLVGGLWQIRSLLRRYPTRTLEGINFVSTNHPAAPFSFFHWLFWKNDIELESTGGQSVFRHELVHMQQKHSLDKLLMQVVLIVCWVNPSYWLMRRELHMIHEFIADKNSVGNEGTGALAAMIMQSVYGTDYSNLVNPFFQQPIKRRLTMLQKTLAKPNASYAGRILALPLFTLLLFAFAKKEARKNEDNKSLAISKPATDTIPTDSIAAVDVATKDSITTITIMYKNGKKETYTEKEAREKGILAPPPPPPPLPGEALVVIDGKVKGTVKESGGLENLLKAEEIESINVLKDSPATAKWGEKGKNGVIEINTKSAASDATKLKPRQDVNITHLEVDKAPAFPGGVVAWRKFLQENLNAAAPVENGAPPGAHVVQVQFKVATDGTISEIEPASAIGYGMEKEVVALMKKSPKWVPAEINGYAVTTLHKQKVTFIVAER